MKMFKLITEPSKEETLKTSENEMETLSLTTNFTPFLKLSTFLSEDISQVYHLKVDFNEDV